MKRICTSSVGCPTADERCDAPLQQRDVVLQPRQGVTNKTVEDLCAVLSLVFSLHWIQGDHYLLPGQQPGQTTPSVRHVQLILAHVWWGKEGILCRIGTVLSAIRPSIEMATVSIAPSIALTIDTVPKS